MLTLTVSMATICGLASLVAGVIDAIAGGGGLLTIPALLLTGVPPHIALGTNKISASLGTIVALVNFSRHHLVMWRLAFYGLGFSLIGSWLGSLLALYLDPVVLGKILIILLPFAMIATLVPARKQPLAETSIMGARFWLLLPVICLTIGCYDGFFGPATGSFLILGLHWVLGLGLIRASATAKAFNLGSNISAAVSFIWHGAVFWPLGLIMGACLMLGNWFGSRLAIKVGSKVVRRFLVVSLFLLLASLVWQYFFK